MSEQTRIKMSATYGRLLKSREYKVDTTTGKNLISMGLAVASPRKRKKIKPIAIVAKAVTDGDSKGVN